MNNKIVCPVCDRSAIEISICPNCQTDLSLIRMLSELQSAKSIESRFQWLKWSIGILAASILFGWGTWMF